MVEEILGLIINFRLDQQEDRVTRDTMVDRVSMEDIAIVQREEREEEEMLEEEKDLILVYHKNHSSHSIDKPFIFLPVFQHSTVLFL